MARFSRYYENLIWNHMLRGEPFRPPQRVYMGLLNAAPTSIRAAAEVSGSGYERQAVEFAEATAGVLEVGQEVGFPVAQSGWGTVVAIGVYDDAEAGNLLLWSELAEAKPIGVPDLFKFPVGMFDLAFADVGG